MNNFYCGMNGKSSNFLTSKKTKLSYAIMRLFDIIHYIKKRIPFMSDKRQFRRYQCRLKAKFFYYDGELNSEKDTDIKTQKCAGHILDISRGGIFISTNENLGINRHVRLMFKTNNQIFDETGTIVRTGLIKNNPSEILVKFENLSISEKSYIAIQFDKTLGEIDYYDVYQ